MPLTEIEPITSKSEAKLMMVSPELYSPVNNCVFPILILPPTYVSDGKLSDCSTGFDCDELIAPSTTTLLTIHVNSGKFTDASAAF